MTNSRSADVRGLPVSGADGAAVERYDAIVNDLYYYRIGVMDRLESLLEEFPEFVLGQVLRGYFHMSDGTLDAHPDATYRLQMAEAAPATRRERLHQEALRAWIAQDPFARAAAWEQILLEWPTDLLALRQYTGTLFWSGDKRHQAEVIAGVAGAWSSAIPGYGHYLSAHAFAMEEVGQYALAERSARDAIAIEPQDLWALHGLAHVLEMQGRVQEGIELVGEAARFLNDYNLFRGHLWWHLGLFQLSEARYDEVLELFDREIYPRSSTFYLDIQNGASLLIRLECQGIDVGPDRWERLAQASLQSGTLCTIWFTALHHVAALVRTGRISAAQTTLDYLREAGEDAAQPALAHELAQAGASWCQDKSREALDQLLSVRQIQGDLGASHAQQDLYYQMMVTAAVQLNDWNRVRQLLKARLATRVADENTWLEFMNASHRVDTIQDVAAVRAALRWT